MYVPSDYSTTGKHKVLRNPCRVTSCLIMRSVRRCLLLPMTVSTDVLQGFQARDQARRAACSVTWVATCLCQAFILFGQPGVGTPLQESKLREYEYFVTPAVLGNGVACLAMSGTGGTLFNRTLCIGMLAVWLMQGQAIKAPLTSLNAT